MRTGREEDGGNTICGYDMLGGLSDATQDTILEVGDCRSNSHTRSPGENRSQWQVLHAYILLSMPNNRENPCGVFRALGSSVLSCNIRRSTPRSWSSGVF